MGLPSRRVATRACPSRPVVSDPPLLHQLFAIAVALIVYAGLAGTLWRLLRWARTPQPVPIPLTPAPRSRTGVLLRLLLEVFCFRTLLRASPVTWIGCVLMHYGLLVTVLLHLRFLWPQTPLWMVPFIGWGNAASIALVAGVLILLLRRMVVARVRYVSVPSDFGWLLWLLLIAATGALTKYVWFTDAYAVGRYLRAALRFDAQPLDASLVVWLHIVAVVLLIGVFPISKLLHGPGVVFAPTLNSRAQ